MQAFAYSKKPFVSNLIFILLFIVLTVFLLFIGPLDALWAGLLFAMEFIVLLVLGISPFITNHEVGESELILRQGWYFKTKINNRDIKTIDLISLGPSNTGVFFKIFESTVYITTQKKDLIAIQLKEPRRFGLILGKKADRVVFDVINQRRLLSHLEKMGAPILSNPIRGS